MHAKTHIITWRRAVGTCASAFWTWPWPSFDLLTSKSNLVHLCYQMHQSCKFGEIFPSGLEKYRSQMVYKISCLPVGQTDRRTDGRTIPKHSNSIAYRVPSVRICRPYVPSIMWLFDKLLTKRHQHSPRRPAVSFDGCETGGSTCRSTRTALRHSSAEGRS